ncbi:MAG: ferredoxin [Ignavibacteria bacterium]
MQAFDAQRITKLHFLRNIVSTLRFYMAIYITSDCINCGACEPECPNTAIYEAGAPWELAGVTYNDSTSPGNFSGDFFSTSVYYIVPDKCTECEGFYDEPQCAAVCPVDCCLPDPNNPETKEQLLKKKEYLDTIDPGRLRV